MNCFWMALLCVLGMMLDGFVIACLTSNPGVALCYSMISVVGVLFLGWLACSFCGSCGKQK
jgi:hypothetical protein